MSPPSLPLLALFLASLFILVEPRGKKVHQPPVAVYIHNKLYPGLNENLQFDIDVLKASGFNEVVGWAIHVRENGDLVYNDILIVSDGKYVGHPDWPAYVAQLKTGNTTIKQLYFSVGAWGNPDFANIHNLVLTEGIKCESVLYRNFNVLKTIFPDVTGMDLDNEDFYSEIAVVNLSLMLGEMGYKKISFCAYVLPTFWINCLRQIEEKRPGLVTQVNLMCYAGGSGNEPLDWQRAINAAGFSTPVIPGLWTEEDSLGEMILQFQAWRLDGIKGGFVYLYDDMHKLGESPSSYARAIKGDFH